MIEADHGGEEDFKNQWGLKAIRADRAYAQLELEHGAGTQPGSGQTVGLIDTGIDTAHQVFAGKTVTEEHLNNAPEETGDERSHGTAVASVIVGRPSAAFTASVTAARGVARGADVAMFAVPTGSGGGNYVPISLPGLASADDRWATRFNHVINWSNGGRSIDFVNVSVGYEGIIDQYSTQQLRTDFGDSIAALAQTGASEKTVFVWAAGNAHGDPCDPADFTDDPDLCVNGSVDAKSVEVLPGLPARISELRGHVVAVVAVAPDSDDDGDYEIASFSNRCGIAADWCLAAPGSGVRAAYFGPDPDDNSPGARGAYNASGTSVAAPMVTGALVVMKHYFRSQLSNTELVARLLETANKGGIYGDSATYGRGLLDLGTATAPVGTTIIALGNTVGEPGSNVAQTRFALGGALGYGLTQSLGGQEIAAFDALGAPFWFPLGALTRAADGPTLATRLHRFMGLQPGVESGTRRPLSGGLAFDVASGASEGLTLGFLEEPAAGGHLSLAPRALTARVSQLEGFRFAAFSTEGMDRQAPASGALLSWSPSRMPLSLRGGMLAERKSLLGSTAGGAFGRLSADSAFVGIAGSMRFNAWRLGADAEFGTVNTAVRGGLLAGIPPMMTSAFTLRAERRLVDGSALLISVAQPLRVEAGRAELSVPVGRTKDGKVLRQPVSARLVPTGRQIEVAAQWRRPLTAGGEFRLGASWTRQPGHNVAADRELRFLAGWRRAF